MKFVFLLTFTFLLCLGCGEGERPLDENENDEFAVAGANALLPKLKLLSYEDCLTKNCSMISFALSMTKIN